MHVYTKTQFNDTRKNYRNLLLVKTDKMALTTMKLIAPAIAAEEKESFMRVD